jgi:hypothetical protein
MQQSFGQRAAAGPAVLGVLLIVLGAAALILRDLGFNLFQAVGTWGWPFFVIVPGVVLLAAALIPAPPRGIGFATAGAIVTTVGAILLYQSRTGHWESWAYAWALLPLGAGAATLLYGLFAREGGMVKTGLTMVAIASAMFLVGAWFFEGVFAGEPRPTDVGAWWPVGVIVLGGVIVLRAVLLPAPRSSSSGEAATGPAETADQAQVA